MTEAEWLACKDPQKMLKARYVRRKLSPRKARLFAASCCRRLSSSLTAEESWRAVQVAEAFADGLADRMELEAAAIDAAVDTGSRDAPEYPERITAWVVCAEDALLAAEDASEWATRAIAKHAERTSAWQGALAAEQAAHAELLRDTLGNPFVSVTANASWLAWNNSTVTNLAQAIYADRAFDRLPILADALEDAGCNQQDILNHLRGGGEHCRGCWALDLVLGRE
jgi:hypothetical protein